jgi:hypothetical protein
VEISFETKELRTLCETLDNPPSEFQFIAPVLKTRLADLRALQNVSEIENIWPNIESNSLNYSMQLDQEYTLVFSSSIIKPPLKMEGGVDWSKVSRIKLIEISRSN